MMSTKATPGPSNNNKERAASPWLSPTASWTPAPDAVHLTETDDDISPTSSTIASPKFFSFASPRPSKETKFFSPLSSTSQYNQTPSSRQHGNLTAGDTTRSAFRRRHKPTACAFLAVFWVWGAFALSSLQRQSHDPISVTVSQDSPSGVAKAAFANLFPRDWGASPSLWVVLDASTSKRVKVLQAENIGDEDSHSFTDDTSIAYEEGKHFCYDLTDALEEKFQAKGTPTPSVRIISYYSLQEQGLDYVARHLVTPDGSKTMVQVQFIEDEIGVNGVQDLKDSIVEFAKEHQPAFLDVHFTGQHWNGPLEGGYASQVFFFGLVTIALAGLFWKNTVGVQHPSMQWGFMIAASMATTLSGSTILLTSFATNITASATSTLLALSFVLSVCYSKLQLDATPHQDKIKFCPWKLVCIVGGIA